jgi:glycosyltransferase involved in cell wall biosynthesis
MAGCEVELASEFRSWEGEGDLHRQEQIETRGREIADRLIAQYRQQPSTARPHCWFTYHLYHKAPDWIGPAVSQALDIPYVIAEASIAQKQCHGKWHRGYDQSMLAVKQAKLIFNLNCNDLAGLQPFVKNPDSIIRLKPFIEVPRLQAARLKLAGLRTTGLQSIEKARLRNEFAIQHHLDPDKYWLLCVAMMRQDSKLDSYRILADTVTRLERTDWQLLIAGDGPAEQQVKDLFSVNQPGQVHFLGRRNSKFIYPLMRSSDLFVWPAQNEAFGMAVLEALGCGLPVAAGNSGGISDIIEHDVTGILIEQPDGVSMAVEIEKLLADPATLEQMSAASLAAFQKSHRLDSASATIGAALKKSEAK